MALEDDTFLGRWSRRKHAARRGETLPEAIPETKPADEQALAAPAEAAGAAPAEAAPPELPTIDSLNGLASEYRDFLHPGVDPATRSAALKKLFSDPHFHFDQMDKLDVYIDDYTKPDPIPAALLKVLSQARGLGLFDEAEKTAHPGDVAETAPAQADVAALEPPAPPALEAEPEPAGESPADVPAKSGEA
jgi:hypothetical protein